jgi:phosphoribosylformylglycinamidine synthase
VSLYNETEGTAILPTPAVAMVGILEGASPDLSNTFREGQAIALLGGATSHLGGSLYLYAEHALERGMPPPVDYAAERALHDVVRKLVRQGLVQLAHDLSDGGLGVALAEACVAGVGCDVLLPGEGRLDERLFGEDHGRILIAFAPEALAEIEAVCADQTPFLPLGRAGGDRLRILDGAVPIVDLPVQEVASTWANTLPEML